MQFSFKKETHGIWCSVKERNLHSQNSLLANCGAIHSPSPYKNTFQFMVKLAVPPNIHKLEMAKKKRTFLTIGLYQEFNCKEYHTKLHLIISIDL